MFDVVKVKQIFYGALKIQPPPTHWHIRKEEKRQKGCEAFSLSKSCGCSHTSRDKINKYLPYLLSESFTVWKIMQIKISFSEILPHSLFFLKSNFLWPLNFDLFLDILGGFSNEMFKGNFCVVMWFRYTHKLFTTIIFLLFTKCVV